MDVRGFLSTVRARLRLVLVLDGLARLVVVALAACALAVLIDYFCQLAGIARLVVLVAIAAAIVALFHRRLLRPLGRRMDDRVIAQLAERRMPGLDGRLLSEVDGIAMTDGQLVGALTREAVTSLVPAASVPRWLGLALLAVIVVVAAGVFLPGFFKDGVNRLFLPLGDSEWERKTTISGHLERNVVPLDEPLVVAVDRTAGPEAPLRLSWQSGQRGPTESRQLGGLTGHWHQALALPPGVYELSAESGDARPLLLTGRVVTRPLLRAISATLTPPPYAKLEPQQLATLGCSALPGSRIDFTLSFALEPGRTVSDAAVTLDGHEVPVTRDGDTLKGSLLVRAGGVLAIALHDQDGIGPSPEPRFTLALSDDRGPLVSLSGPLLREAVTARAKVAITVDASDDYGLGELQLIARTRPAAEPQPVEGQPAAKATPPKEAVQPFPGIAGRRAATTHATVTIAEIAVEGDLVTLLGRAKDGNDVTGPGIGESQPLELKVVSESELIQELDRLLAEAKDRITQARVSISQGLAKPEALANASRGAALAAGKAGETLAQVVRRWQQNQLPGEQLTPISGAADLVNGPAASGLIEAIKGQEKPAHDADDALAKAERLLASLLQEGDLTRLLASLLEREKNLNAESKAFVLEHLTKPLDAAAHARQANLAGRQKELADALKDIERRLLGAPDAKLAPVQDLLRQEAPADQLQQAAGNLGSDTQRSQAVKQQEQAIQTLAKLLDLLRGGDADKDLARHAGELAARQERLLGQLEQGVNPKSLAEQQEQLRKETEQFGKQLGEKHADVAKTVDAAVGTQGAAQKSMQGGDQGQSEANAGAAASLLREVQKQLDPQSDQDKDKDKQEDEKKKKGKDVMALLKELHREQVKLLTDSTPIHQRIADGALDFAAQRDVPALGEREGDLHLRLTEEGIKELDKQPIAAAALGRVGVALEKSAKYLSTPALGERGMRLERIALYELARLIAIVDGMPPPKQSEKKGGGGGQQGTQAPFPPEAELGLLAAMQEEIAALTAADRPIDLAALQKKEAKLVEMLEGASRPGSRPSLLLARARRAMDSA
ncbi:MAG: hypothetical protein H0X38_07310, partial [Planctomycetes bacterium]|nr:hypothetical protein [Planctomycetota bacterium]